MNHRRKTAVDTKNPLKHKVTKLTTQLESKKREKLNF